MGASIVAGVDASPVFEASEHVLDFVPLTVEDSVVADRRLAVCSARNTGCNAALLEFFAEPIGIVASIAEQFSCRRQRIQHQGRAFVVAYLSFVQHKNDRLPLAIADGMQLGVQAALRAPDTSGNRPFFKRLAAVRCAFKCVASIISRDDLPALRASS